jgi:hypothetical protein
MLTLCHAHQGRIVRRIFGFLCLTSTTAFVLAQDATYPPHRPSPPKIEPKFVLIADSVVETQWTHTLNLVNAPQGITLLNPGQCVRIGIYATGDDRDDYLKKTKLSFRVSFANHSDIHPLSYPVGFKQIKPEGGDFVAAALGAAGVAQPESTKTMASLGVSADKWCAPADAGDGTATVEAEIEPPNGHQALDSSTVQIESFEAGSKKEFKDGQELGSFAQTYYRQPNPARLLPVLRFLMADESGHSRPGQVEIIAAFLCAALKSAPTAAQDFLTRVSGEPPRTRALGLLILRSGGYGIERVLDTMSADDQKKFSSLSPLQDPFDLTPTQDLFQHLDMLWAVFGATGEFKPVQTVSSALTWRTDYDDFDKLRKTPNHPSTLTPSIIRGVTYTAAGWSLWSFQRNDPLVADYIDYLLASADTPQSVKSELRGLWSNPAFKRAGGQ